MRWARGTAPLVVAFGVAGAAVALLAFSSTLNPIDALRGRGAIVTVPDLEGRTQPRAEADATDAGLEPEARTAFSLTVPRGRIIGQDPRPGERVREGTELELIVSRGANRVEMPDAVGRPLREVTPPLEDAGVPIDEQRVPDEVVPEGVVISQDPAPGVLVTGDAAVTFEVSAGPADRPVPEVARLTIEAAAFRLGDVGLAVEGVRFVDDDEVRSGVVAGTDPPAGTEVERDAEVTILVSGGRPAVEVPEVAGTTEAAARERLEAAGFRVATSGELLSPDQGGVGSVLRQHPVPGSKLRPDDVVTIVVGRVATHPPPMPTTTTTTTALPEPPAPPGGGGG